MKFGSLIIGLLLGGVITFLGLNYLPNMHKDDAEKGTTDSSVKKPLYWVAPMDPNYKRDKPGKSPMGMDLIPFYEDSGSNDEIGTVKISPEVVNNLGVRTDLVSKQTLNSKVETVGYVSYDEDHLVHIHPRVKGWIDKLYIKASGDPVTKGQALYEIYSPEIVNAQEEFLLALDRKNVRLIKASKERLLSLRVSNKIIDEVEKTKKVMQRVTIYAPKSGIVANLQIREGFFVQPGKTIMSIGTLKQVWVNAEIFERQASIISIGDLVEMKLDFIPGKTWKGKVDYIYPTLDTKTRTIKVRLKFENKDELLKPGMFANIDIQSKKVIKALVVPKEALIRTGNSNRVVLALDKGKFKSVNVKVGKFDTKYVEILYGLKEGEKIVTSAQFLLDSESSKTSDFKRMGYEEEKETITNTQSEEEPKEWVQATVVKTMLEDNAIKVTHSAIPNWKWPAMTMNFPLNKNLNISMFKEDMQMDIEITKTKNNKYIITDIKMKH